jgi:riboflavin biosynthesis pyrimidine reductase
VLDPGLTCRTSARLLGLLDENEDGGAVLLYTADGLEQDPERAERAERLRDAGALIAPIPGQGDRLDLSAVLADLRARGVLGVLVEGGSRAAGAFLVSRLVDRLWIHVGPVVLGGDGTVPAFAGFGASTLGEAVKLRHLRCEQVGDDVALEAMVEGGFDVDAELALIERIDAGER